MLIIDGSRFDDFAGYCREFSALLDDWTWRGNLYAFNDILRCGFGTPEDGFVLRWVNSARSREAIGWSATIEKTEQKLEGCYPTTRDHVQTALKCARRHEGQTSSTRSSTSKDHGPGGAESKDRVELELQ